MLSWDSLKPKEEKRQQLDNDASDASGSHDRLPSLDQAATSGWAEPTTALAWQNGTHSCGLPDSGFVFQKKHALTPVKCVPFLRQKEIFLFACLIAFFFFILFLP